MGPADFSTMWPQPHLLESVTKGFKNCMARSNHIRVKFKTSGFKDFKILFYIMYKFTAIIIKIRSCSKPIRKYWITFAATIIYTICPSAILFMSTKKFDSNGTTSHMHSRSAQFKSHLGHQLSWQVFIVFLSPSTQTLVV
jgi:hypothetical protein